MMRNYRLSVLVFLLMPTVGRSLECIGPKGAKHSAVYLHGMDTEIPGQQEILIRQRLTTLATRSDMRFALPRATKKCPTNAKLICWGWNFREPGVIDSALSTAASAAKECFSEAKNVGLIGFSNGGFVVNQILRDCRPSPFTWHISVGAAGSWSDLESRDFSKCAKVTLFAGKQDKFNYASIKGLAEWFKEYKARVDLIEYDDGHTIPTKELEQYLKFVLK